MSLPFSDEQFSAVFSQYNEAVWPVQVFLAALAVVAFGLVFVPKDLSGAVISLILAFLWAWFALAYHFLFFAHINPLAYVFSAFSLMAAVVFLWQGVVRRRLRFRWTGGAGAAMGSALIVFALFIYPAWSWLAGHRYPAMPTFGLPCPTTIFTIGMLAFLATPYRRTVLLIPLLWSVVGAQAAFTLGIPQDLGLIVAAFVGVMLLVQVRPQSTEAVTS